MGIKPFFLPSNTSLNVCRQLWATDTKNVYLIQTKAAAITNRFSYRYLKIWFFIYLFTLTIIIQYLWLFFIVVNDILLQIYHLKIQENNNYRQKCFGFSFNTLLSWLIFNCLEPCVYTSMRKKCFAIGYCWWTTSWELWPVPLDMLWLMLNYSPAAAPFVKTFSCLVYI